MTPSELAFLQAVVLSLPRNPSVVEIGSWKGRSTVAICEALQITGGRLIAVDTFRGDIHTGEADVEVDFRENTAAFEELLDVFVSDSVSAAKLVPEASVDCVFIDAEHTYASTLADIDAWIAKVKPSGVICGHDYGHYGLTLAIHQRFGVPQHWESIWVTRADQRRWRGRWAVEARLRKLARRV